MEKNKSLEEQHNMRLMENNNIDEEFDIVIPNGLIENNINQQGDFVNGGEQHEHLAGDVDEQHEHLRENAKLKQFKSRTMEDDFDALEGISKKLFASPLATPPTSVQGKRGSSSSKGKKAMTGSASVGSKQYKSVLPKGIKWNFPITSDMKLDFPELQAIAYVYHPDKDKSKRLVSSRGIEAYRADFDTLTPGHMINHKIMKLVCLRASWMQQNYNRGSVWFLPPGFADDVFLGKTIEELVATYCKDWMPSYPRLKYIYVPINTLSDHWFFMVISMQLQTIYHLDSFCGIGDVKPRRATISIISNTLQQMVSSGFYGTTFLGRSTEFNEWPIEEAHGIPNCGHSNNTTVWVIDWIDMDQCCLISRESLRKT
ncbi:ubiquitin-specific protease ESD4 [Trifolium repens]|nr:ubiquitin-specific protease ESD4 [Trifolium repens]